MKFSEGDLVKIKRSGDEGRIIECLSNGYYKIKIGEQAIPVNENELEYPYLDWFLQQRKEIKKKKLFIDNIKKEAQSVSEANANLPHGVFLFFQPIFRDQDEEDVIHRFRLMLFNNTDSDFSFFVEIKHAKKHLFAHEGVLYKNQQIMLYTIFFEDISDNPSFQFEWQYIQGKNKAEYVTHFKINRKWLIEQIQNLQKVNLGIFSYTIFDKLTDDNKKIDPIENLKISKEINSLGLASKKLKAKAEIDLHFEKIYPQKINLSNAEILQLQLDYFMYYLELAISDGKINPFRVIHGIGDGVLKSEINKLCKQTNGVVRYVYESYNPGITLIYLK